MIRNATYADVPEMIELGAAMHCESVYAPFSYNKDKVGTLLDTLIYTELGICLVAVNQDEELIGGMLGELVPHYFGDGLMAFDYALFMDPQYRGARDGYLLVKEFTKQSIEKGAVHIVSGTSTGVNPETTEKLYRKLGYDEIGKLFTMKVMENF